MDVAERAAKEQEEMALTWAACKPRRRRYTKALLWVAAGTAAALAAGKVGYDLLCYDHVRWHVPPLAWFGLGLPPLVGVLSEHGWHRVRGLLMGAGLTLLLLQACSRPTPPPPPTPTPSAAPGPERPSPVDRLRHTFCTPTPTPTPTPSPTPTPQPYFYTVQEKESLSIIAARFGLTVEDLKKANHLSNDIIYAGQRLRIPVNPPDTLDPILHQLMLTERPIREEHQQAWGALYIFGDPP